MSDRAKLFREQVERSIKAALSGYVGKTITPEMNDAIKATVMPMLAKLHKINPSNIQFDEQMAPKNLYTALLSRGIIVPYEMVADQDTYTDQDGTIYYVKNGELFVTCPWNRT